MSELTLEMKDKYIHAEDVICPWCGGENIESGHLEKNDDGTIVQDIYCKDCGKCWQDVYTLTDVVDDNDGNQ